MPYAVKEMHDVERFIYDQGYSQSTARSYRYYLKRFDEWLSASGMEVNDEVQPDHLRRFIEANNWSPNTQTVVYCALIGYLRWKYGADHPALAWKPRRGDTVRLLRYLDKAQLRFILDWLHDQGTEPTIRDEAMIALMADTGLRVSEICRLQLGAVDLTKRRLSVRIKGGDTGQAIYSEPTGRRIESWLQTRGRVLRRTEARARRLKTAYKRPTELFVSVGGNQPGHRLTRNGVKKNFLLIGKRSGFGKLAPHDLRRTFAMLAIRNGAPTRLVQVAGRWSSLDMVERYSKFIEVEDVTNYLPLNGFDDNADIEAL